MDYTQMTEPQRHRMLEAIGVKSVDELFTTIPEAVKLDRPLDIPESRSELELQRELQQLAGENVTLDERACFMGAGVYDHFIPAVVDDLSSRGDFVTAYTPYQAEASQGALQAFFEFQTQVARLAGLDIANASLYEGANAMAEAAFMAINVTGKRRILVASTLHPHYRRVLATSVGDLPAEVIELPATDGRIPADAVREEMDSDTACVIVQSPNVFGLIEDWAGTCAVAHSEKKTLGIAVFNPIAAALLKRPGECGADVAVGEGQPLGIPPAFGGPHLGLFAVTKKLMRKMPGRLVGRTHDADGTTGYCLTLQTREQHIRGAKATSNICTNQGLLALRATVYMTAMGPRGLREAAEQSYHKAHYAADAVAKLDGYDLPYAGRPFFHEFVVRCPKPAAEVIDAAADADLLPGVDLHALGASEHPNDLLIAVTEKRTRDEIDQLVTCLKEVA